MIPSEPTRTSVLSTEDHESWRYFQEAALLRTCLAYNEEDYNFARRGGRITYIFDANIVAFFLQPERENERRKIIAFRSDGRAKGYASATALITAEYLFSRRLAGQHNHPAFIAPTHGDDLADIIGQIQKEIENDLVETPNEDNIAHITNYLNEVVQRIQQRHYRSIEQVAGALRRYVPKLADELEDRFAALQQLARIYDQDLLRPLALHAATTIDVLLPDDEQIKDWSRLIKQERAIKGKSQSSTKAERDATALLQVMLLDASIEAEERDRHRYVLVTADIALFDAYTRWYWESRPNDRMRFALRLPIQYIPILNTHEMPNDVLSGEITSKAFLALDSLFGNLKTVEKINYRQKLAYYRLEYPGAREDRETMVNLFNGIDPFEFAIDDFMAARSEWNKCYANATVLNAPLMHRRHSEAFEGLVRALARSPNLREAIARDQLDSLSRIVGAHASYMTPATARDLAGMPGHRIPFLLRLDECGFPASILELLRGEGRPLNEETLADLSGVIGEEQSVRSLLLASIVAFRNGKWVGARAFARHALSGDVTGHSVAGAQHMYHELRYLAAASTRYTLALIDELNKLPAQVEEARADLNISTLVGAREDDHFIMRRAHVEEQALELTLVRLAMHGPVPVPKELERGIASAPNILRTCMAFIEAPFDGCSTSLSSALSSHTRRIGTGAAAQLFLAEMAEGTSPISRDELDQAFTTLLAGRTREWNANPIHELHYLLGNLATRQMKMEDFLRELEALRGKFAGDWTSPLDQLEFEQTLRRMRAAPRELPSAA